MNNSQRADELVGTLQSVPSALIVMHDNPDPDAIASAWCVLKLAETAGLTAIRAVAGGAIVRSENAQMVRLLRPPITLLNESDPISESGAVLVDCGVGATNQLVTRNNIRLLGVIDHHQQSGRCENLLFTDVRSGTAACASIAAGYLMARGIEPSAELATAVWYALRTETCAYESRYTDLDRDVLIWATMWGSPSLLAEIENSPLSREYFSDLLLALQNTFLYANTAVCFLPRAEGVEIVGEVADLLVREVDVSSAISGAVLDDDLYVSARTAPDGGNATSLLHETIDGLGSGGGHVHRAGGKISRLRDREQSTDDLLRSIRKRWLRANGIRGVRRKRLVRLQEIITNLSHD